MDEWLAPTAILGALGILGTYLGITLTRSSSRDTLLLASRDNHIDDLREDLKDTRDRLSSIETTVAAQTEQIRQLQMQETGLRRYVIRLKEFIRSMGETPPEPPSDLKF